MKNDCTNPPSIDWSFNTTLEWRIGRARTTRHHGDDSDAIHYSRRVLPWLLSVTVKFSVLAALPQTCITSLTRLNALHIYRIDTHTHDALLYPLTYTFVTPFSAL